MRAIHNVFVTLSLALPLSLFAQSSTPLVPDATLRANDSPLVRAAKIAIAGRVGQPSRILDNTAIANSKGVISTATGSADIPGYQSMYPGAGAGQSSQSSTPKVDRAAIQKKVQQLNQEQARMAGEAEQPYGGDVSEDRVHQRQEQIPQEKQQLQQQLNPPPPPRPPNQ